jgi:hypothetical protein
MRKTGFQRRNRPGMGGADFTILLLESKKQGIRCHSIENDSKEAPARFVRSLEYMKTLKQ